MLAARRLERLEELVAKIKKGGGQALAVPCDVTRDGDPESAVQAAVREYGKLDVAVANAGFGVAAPFEKLTLEDYRRQFETNVFGLLRTSYAALPELKKSRGSLVLLGSVAGHISLPGNTPYTMSKFCVRALAEGLRYELKPAGVAVTLISPGFVDSEIRMIDNRGHLHSDASDPVPAWIRVPAKSAAREIARAIERRKAERIVTFHGKVAVLINRHFPWLLNLAKGGGLRSRPEPRG